MAEGSDGKPERRRGSLVGSAIRTGAKAWTTASEALRSQPVRRLRGGLQLVAGGLVGVTRFVRANSLRGLLKGEVIITERSLNRWFARVEPPEGVAGMALRCRPSRLVLAMSFERRLFGLRLGRTTVELPFGVEDVEIDHRGGTIELRLDREALPELRGFIRPVAYRLLSRAAADLLDDASPLDRIDELSDVIRRQGDRLIVDVGLYPPFVELMSRELRLIGGRSLFPFRAIVIHGARVEEGRLVVHTRLDRDQLAARRTSIDLDEIDALAEDDEEIEVAIVAPEPRDDDFDSHDDFDDYDDHDDFEPWDGS